MKEETPEPKSEEQAEQKLPYEAPRVESIRLSKEAAEALT